MRNVELPNRTVTISENNVSKDINVAFYDFANDIANCVNGPTLTSIGYFEQSLSINKANGKQVDNGDSYVSMMNTLITNSITNGLITQEQVDMTEAEHDALMVKILEGLLNKYHTVSKSAGSRNVQEIRNKQTIYQNFTNDLVPGQLAELNNPEEETAAKLIEEFNKKVEAEVAEQERAAKQAEAEAVAKGEISLRYVDKDGNEVELEPGEKIPEGVYVETTENFTEYDPNFKFDGPVTEGKGKTTDITPENGGAYNPGTRDVYDSDGKSQGSVHDFSQGQSRASISSTSSEKEDASETTTGSSSYEGYVAVNVGNGTSYLQMADGSSIPVPQSMLDDMGVASISVDEYNSNYASGDSGYGSIETSPSVGEDSKTL